MDSTTCAPPATPADAASDTGTTTTAASAPGMGESGGAKLPQEAAG